MPQRMCPRCHQVVTYMEHSGDVVHTCNSGNDTLDQEDIFNLTDPHWNLLGAENQLSPDARIEGEDFEGVTSRGLRKSSYRQEQHEEHIELR